MTDISLQHEDGSVLAVRARGTEILRYAYRPGLPASECPAPHFHPLRTLSGGTVTGNRPHDHRWHKGLAMTASHLSGQNFWGGPTWTGPEHGYAALPNVGRLDHAGFTDRPDRSPQDGAAVTERVHWTTAEGDRWIEEERDVAVRDVDPEGGSWTLEFGTALHNVRGAPLEFGSPTVFGRELAGYCGFFWRGPRSFTGGIVQSEAAGGLVDGEEAMGTRGSWLSFTGAFDGRDGEATLVFADCPDNPGHPAHWFVRTEPFPVVNPSLAFFDPLVLGEGDTLRLRYRVVVADGYWDAGRIGGHLAEHPW